MDIDGVDEEWECLEEDDEVVSFVDQLLGNIQ